MANESDLVTAHRQALLDANEHFAAVAQHAMSTYPMPEVQIAYLSGYIQQLKRLGMSYVDFSAAVGEKD